MKQSDVSSSSSTPSKHCGCSPTSVPVCGGFQFANMASFGMGGGCSSFSDLNTLQQQLSDAQNAHESGQVRGFDADYAKKIGGYPKTALVSDPKDPTRLFISTKDDNSTDPTTDKSGAWFPLTDTLTATRDALTKEEQRARSAEAALQPKGDYATNDGLNAETNRAKSVEATLQPKGDYATHSDLSAEAQRAQNAEATLQPKGDYATNDGLNAETNRAKSVEATLQPKGDYATHSDLSAEAQRAQNAEAALQPKGDYATNDGLNAETNRAKSVEATLQPKGDYATHSDLSAEAQRAQNAEAALQSKGDYATNDGLNAETNRAKSVEATLQPKGDYATRNDLSTLGQNKVDRSGDTMTGDLTITHNGQWGDYVYGGKIVSTIAGRPENSFLQSQLVEGKPATVVGAQDDQGKWHTWYFNISDATIKTPSGNNLLETGNTEGRRMRQSFRTTAKNGDRINWPKAYAKDDLVVPHFTATDNGNGQLHLINILANTQPDRSGCYVAIETVAKDTKDKLYSIPDPVTIDVTVEGWAA